MSDTNTDSRLEKGEEKVDVHEQLAAEVYGRGDVDKFSFWGLRLRALVSWLGAEENGIERIPPSARIDQNPIGTSVFEFNAKIVRFVLLLYEWELLCYCFCLRRSGFFLGW